MSQPNAGARHLRIARNERGNMLSEFYWHSLHRFTSTVTMLEQVKKTVFNAEQLTKMGITSSAPPNTDRSLNKERPESRSKPAPNRNLEYIELTDDEHD